jgi:hypothetical protein
VQARLGVDAEALILRKNSLLIPISAYTCMNKEKGAGER